MASSRAIKAERLTRIYGETLAVDGVSFAVDEGTIFGYLGRNGSGKSTTVRVLTTLLRPSSGRASVAGFDVETEAPAVRARIGVTMQDAALDPEMAAREHLLFIARLSGFAPSDASERAAEVLTLMGLEAQRDDTIATFSGGMKRRLDLATALLAEPPVLFLDEPTTGLDPQSRLALWDELRRLRASGVTIFLTTQYLEEAEQLCDHLAVIEAGRIIASGTVAEIKRHHGHRIIRFSSNGLSDADLRALASSSGWTASVVAGVAELTTLLSNESASVADMIAKAAASGPVEGLTVADSSLEDVFLDLTGRSISEPAPPALAAS